MKKIFTIITAALFISCDEDVANIWQIDDYKVSALSINAEDTLTIDGLTLTLDAYLFRNLMPPISPETNNLIAINTLMEIDSAKIPSDLEMVRQYVIMGDSIWTGIYTSEKYESQDWKLQRTSINGPNWEPGSIADVIAELTYDKRTYYIISRNETIMAAY